MSTEVPKGHVTCTFNAGKVHAVYKYPAEQKRTGYDWFALFIYDREISYETWSYAKENGDEGFADFDLPARAGYYCVRLYANGAKPQKGCRVELASSEPFLVGSNVLLSTECEAGDDGRQEVVVSCTFPSPSESERTDYVCMYEKGKMSNHQHLAKNAVSVGVGCCNVRTRFAKPAAMGEYEFRYFFNSVDAFSGVSDSIEVPDLSSLTLYADQSTLRVRWCLGNVEKMTGGEWVGVFDAETDARVAWEYVKPTAGTPKGVVSFAKSRLGEHHRVYVRLYVSRTESVKRTDNISI